MNLVKPSKVKARAEWQTCSHSPKIQTVIHGYLRSVLAENHGAGKLIPTANFLAWSGCSQA